MCDAWLKVYTLMQSIIKLLSVILPQFYWLTLHLCGADVWLEVHTLMQSIKMWVFDPVICCPISCPFLLAQLMYLCDAGKLGEFTKFTVAVMVNHKVFLLPASSQLPPRNIASCFYCCLLAHHNIAR